MCVWTTESLCWTVETNTVKQLYSNKNSLKKKLITYRSQKQGDSVNWGKSRPSPQVTLPQEPEQGRTPLVLTR